MDDLSSRPHEILGGGAGGVNVGLAVAQFDRVEDGDAAVKAVEPQAVRVVSALGLRPDLATILESFGLAPPRARQLLDRLRPDRVMLLLLVRTGRAASSALAILWQLGAENLTYLRMSGASGDAGRGWRSLSTSRQPVTAASRRRFSA